MHRLLLIDDDKDALQALHYVLSDNGFHCDAFACVHAALDYASRYHFDVVICDYRMSEMNGLECLRNIAQRHPGTTRVLMSAMDDSEILQQAINDAHIYAFIRKPWSAQAMVRTVADAIVYKTQQDNVAKLEKLLSEQREIIRYQSSILDRLEASQPGITERYLIDAAFS